MKTFKVMMSKAYEVVVEAADEAEAEYMARDLFIGDSPLVQAEGLSVDVVIEGAVDDEGEFAEH